MSEQEKKQQRIFDLLKTVTKPKKNSEITGFSLWPPSSLDFTLYGVFKKMQLPIQILVSLRLLLKRNGIKYQKNLF